MRKITQMLLSVTLIGGVCSLEGAHSQIYANALKNKNLQWTESILENKGKETVVFPLEMHLGENQRLTIPVRLAKKGSFSIATGRGKEVISVARTDNFIRWNYVDPSGVSVKKPVQWWENTSYWPNGNLRDSFGFSDTLRDWNTYLSGRFQRDIEQTFFSLSLELRQDKFRIYFDDILLAEQDITGKRHDWELNLTLPPKFALKEWQSRKLSPISYRFHMVNLTRRFNTEDTMIRLPVERGEEFIFQGIPFELSHTSEKGFSHIDLGLSWFREGMLDTYEEPNQGSFGGRWSGALSGNPTRIQFRLPNRPYTAIYLLASCKTRPDRIPELTAQFYRPASGFPKNFTPDNPVISDGKLQVIRIPVQPGQLREFSDRNTLEMELTGNVHVYRAWPDPSHYSIHGGGIPSGVQIYAMTLETAPFDVEFEPEAFGNVWTEESPAYKVTLYNRSVEKQTLHLQLRTSSFDEKEELKMEQKISIEPSKTAITRFELPLRKYGWHKVQLNIGGLVYEHTLTRLRRRELKARTFGSKGFMFGFWNWAGSHLTPKMSDVLRLMGPLGMESFSHNPNSFLSKDTASLAEYYGMKNFWTNQRGIKALPESPEQIAKALKETCLQSSKISEPVYLNIFAEPGGIGTHGNLPEFYGEAPYIMKREEREKFLEYKKKILNSSLVIRQKMPSAKILMPWGDPVFAVPFLQDMETRHAFDGIAFDTGYFDRLPEQQFHQNSIHRMKQFLHYWKKFRKEPPVMISVEGPCLSQVMPGALTEIEHAAYTLRCALLLGAYGINRQFSIVGPADCASYWGEQHYGGGVFSRLNDLNPHVTYAALGSMIRHLRHMEFVKWIPTGSLSVYCLQFKDARNGELLHVLWTLRGQRDVKLKYTKIFDAMDNLVEKTVLGPLPIFVYGNDGSIELCDADHADSVLAQNRIKLGNVSELFTQQTQDTDTEYINSFPVAVRRFPTKMKLEKVSEGLSITLPHQKVKRLVMPYYTTLRSDKPILIPGKARYLTMEVTAHSDWGRVVYVLRDAKGEKWISVGTKDAWNSDDTPNASYFNFDGKRLIRFELPSNLPWDNFRESGSTWWGASGGDRIVDLPLSIEKIFIERRSHAMYVNSLEETSKKPVILGGLYAEYDSPELMKGQAMLNMPPPPSAGALPNPIRKLAKEASLPPSTITEIKAPEHYYDGTRGIFYFKEMPGAVAYDIYLSLNPDGFNAIRLGKGLKKSGALVCGFRANTPFYAFVIYHDSKGKHSHPSKAFRFKMQDTFGNK